MIIDCNVHPTFDGKWFASNHNASVSELLKQMDAAKIDKAVLVPFAGIISNEFVRDTCIKIKDRFIPAVSFNPAKYAGAEAAHSAFLKEFLETDAPIIKVHNRLHHYDLLDERVFAVLKANQERAKPFVVFICGLTNSKSLPFLTPPPLVFHKIVTQFPETKFVIMHCAMSWTLQTFEAIKDCPNTSMDLSYVQSKFRGAGVWHDLGFLCRNFDQRIIFGSDFPEINLSQALEDFRVLTEGVDQVKTKNMLSANLLKLLTDHEGR